MSSNPEDPFSTELLQSSSGQLHPDTGINDIVNDHCRPTLNIPDDVFRDLLTSPFPYLIRAVVNNGNWSLNVFSKLPGQTDPSMIRRNNNDVIAGQAVLFTVAGKQAGGLKVIHWNVEETLNLGSMKINGD